MIDSGRVLVVSIDARGPSCPMPVAPLPLFFLFHKLSMECQMMSRNLEVAFFVFLQLDTLSSFTLTLSQPHSRYTGELLSCLSEMVRRRSSIASLTAVTAMMNIRGAELRPGLLTPNIGKH
jgi:hypothetical protein